MYICQKKTISLEDISSVKISSVKDKEGIICIFKNT